MGTGAGPGVYRSVAPAWGDANLRQLAGHLESPLFLAHVRAAVGSPVQETNCHPFRHERWLFVHNGLVAGFHALRRELMLAIDPELFADVQGSTDSEVLLHLALTEGLEDDPLPALERALGRVEAAAERHGIANALQASVGVSDGERVWAVRYSTEGKSRTLFVSGDVHALRQLHPDNPRLQRMRDDDCLVVSLSPRRWSCTREASGSRGPSGRPPPAADRYRRLAMTAVATTSDRATSAPSAASQLIPVDWR
jgi:glutamine amidotransferase